MKPDNEGTRLPGPNYVIQATAFGSFRGPCRNQFRRGFLRTLNDFIVLRNTANNIKIGPQDKRAALTVKLKRQYNSTLD